MKVTGNLDNIEVRWDPSSDLHSDQDIALNLRAVVTDVDAGTASDNPITDTVAPDTSDNVSAVSVTVKAVADQAAITAESVGVEDQWFDLDVGVSLTDTDGSESITSILIEGVPDGAQLNKGTQILDGSGQPTGTWSFQQSELSGLQVKLAQDSNDDFQLTIKVTTEEAASGDQVAVKTVHGNKNAGCFRCLVMRICRRWMWFQRRKLSWKIPCLTCVPRSRATLPSMAI